MGVGARGGSRSAGQYPGESVLSPRGTESGTVGVKMVEYLLASSPTTQMRNMSIRVRLDYKFFKKYILTNNFFQNGTTDGMKEKKDKSQSPFDPTKKDVENGNLPQANGTVQNGLDDDKVFK